MLYFFRTLFVLLLVTGNTTANAETPATISEYAKQLADSMERVLQGSSLDASLPWPSQPLTANWEQEFRDAVSPLQPVQVVTAALSLHWTFFHEGRPTYVAQVTFLPNDGVPTLLKIEETWTTNSGPYPQWMVATQGQRPQRWQGLFHGWAGELTRIQEAAKSHGCEKSPTAETTHVQKFIPGPYQNAHIESLQSLPGLLKRLCAAAKQADSASFFPMRQHFNLLNSKGTIVGGVMVDFRSGPEGLILTGPTFKRIDSVK